MKNKVISILLLLLSLFAFGINLNSARAYYYISKGNSFFKNENFEEARKNYELSLKLKDNPNVKKNIIKSFYEEKKYKEVIENESDEFFLRGNSYAFLGDSLMKENPEEAKKNYKLALEEYKKAMKSSDDINIKKNYEIVLKKIEDLEKEQQQNQDNNKKIKIRISKIKIIKTKIKIIRIAKIIKSKIIVKTIINKIRIIKMINNKKIMIVITKIKRITHKIINNKMTSKIILIIIIRKIRTIKISKIIINRINKINKTMISQNNQNGNDQQDQNQQNNSGENQENNNQPQDQKDKNQGGGASTGDIKDSKEDIKKNEIGVILKRLEGNEKQSFKNNERVMNIETGNSNNKW